jgi:hypothetical protein
MGQQNKPTKDKRPTNNKKLENAKTFKTTPEPNSVKTMPISRTPGATVWAVFNNFFVRYKADPSSGYSHLLTGLNSIDEVVDGLEKAGLRNKVAHLALVGHNEAALAGLDSRGNVTYNPPIPGSELAPPDPKGRIGRDHYPAQPTPVATFKKLEPYLLPDGMLSFFMCESGGGKAGDELLKKVSLILPGRTIVGFCVPVETPNVGDSKPGEACGTQQGACEKLMNPLTPWGLAAKRAKDNTIVHIPALEKMAQNGPPYRCANTKCPGNHPKPDDDCKGY